MSTPSLSVVIPTFNRARSIEACLRSVLAQTRGDFEVIVVDDGSSDDTVEIVERFVTKDSRVRLLRHAVNLGGCEARNTGIDAASAPLLAFLDSDDAWLPEKIAANLAKASEQVGDRWVIYSGLSIRTDEGICRSNHYAFPRGGLADYLFSQRGSLQTSSVVLPTALARSVRFLPKLRRLQDWDFYLRLEAEGADFVLQNEVLVIHDARTDPGRISSRRDAGFLREWIRVRRNLVSKRAYVGFLANKVAPEAIENGDSLRAAGYLAWGVACRAVPPRNASIEVARLVLPRRVFGWLRRRTGRAIADASPSESAISGVS